jgi:hypothetical protein
MNEDKLSEIKKKTADIRIMIEKCNDLMEYIESYTQKLIIKKNEKAKECKLEENPEKLE